MESGSHLSSLEGGQVSLLVVFPAPIDTPWHIQHDQRRRCEDTRQPQTHNYHK